MVLFSNFTAFNNNFVQISYKTIFSVTWDICRIYHAVYLEIVQIVASKLVNQYQNNNVYLFFSL